MDTRYWGPAGWKLIHLVAAVYEPTNRMEMNRWLSTLPYVLPCKFCRASLISYYQELPPDYRNALSLSRWVWRIHGKVNDKLRGQGQTIPADPPFVAVYSKYKGLANNLYEVCKDIGAEAEGKAKGVAPDTLTEYCSEGIWDFLFSVAYQHPRTTLSIPMYDTPPHLPCNLSEPDKCRWNLLEPAEKMPYFRRFWAALPGVLPPQFQERWKAGLRTNPMKVETRGQTLRWLYRQYQAVYNGKGMLREYPAVIEELKKHSSDCNKSMRTRTCRRVPKAPKTRALKPKAPKAPSKTRRQKHH